MWLLVCCNTCMELGGEFWKCLLLIVTIYKFFWFHLSLFLTFACGSIFVRQLGWSIVVFLYPVCLLGPLCCFGILPLHIFCRKQPPSLRHILPGLKIRAWSFLWRQLTFLDAEVAQVYLIPQYLLIACLCCWRTVPLLVGFLLF